VWAGGTPEDSVRDEARQLAYEGIHALREERFAEALTLLRQAEERFHAPTHLLYMARAHAGLGQLVEAHDAYVSVVIEPIPNYAPPAFHEARQQAAAEVEELRPRIATLRVALEGKVAAALTVTVDGHAIAAARLAHPIAVAPGHHRVAAATRAGQQAEQAVTARIGDTTVVTLSFETGPASAPAGSAAELGGDGMDDGSGWTVAGALLVAGGSAAVVAAGVTGGLTLARAGEIEDTCGGNVCPTAEESTVDEAKALGNVSTVLFAVGGAVALAGIVVLATASETAQETTARSARIAVRVTPFGAALTGAF
jgi:hypothetical protein